MDINAVHFEDRSVISVDGIKFLGIEVETFNNAIKNSIDKGSRNISIDLSKVNYISSSGVELLMHAYVACTKKNIGFNVEGASKHVKDVLNTLKLANLFKIS